MKQSKVNKRQTNIEMLKIIAMFLIVISHVTHTLFTEFSWFNTIDLQINKS